MDYRVVWSPEALEDVESIAAYIARDSQRYAASVVEKILEDSRSLALSPYIGRVVPEFENESIRERILYSYRLIYRIEGNVVTIAAVIHGKRLIDTFSDRIK